MEVICNGDRKLHTEGKVNSVRTKDTEGRELLVVGCLFWSHLTCS